MSCYALDSGLIHGRLLDMQAGDEVYTLRCAHTHAMYEVYLINQYLEGRRQILYTHWNRGPYACAQIHETIYHVMPREKRCGALDSCFGLVGPHQQSIPQLLSLAP